MFLLTDFIKFLVKDTREALLAREGEQVIKNIVFDMGGVLIDLDLQRTLDEYFEPEYHSLIRSSVFESYEWRCLDKGTARTEDVIPTILAKLPEKLHPLITEMINDFYPYMPAFPTMYDFVKRIKDAGYGVYLLSNASARVFDRYFDIPALGLMDGLFVSALHKCLKPEEEIYKRFCQHFELKPEECFFIDDMPQNIEGARAFGMKGFIFKAPDTTELEKALFDEGVII